MKLFSNNLIQALEELVEKGYNHDYHISGSSLVDIATGKEISSAEFVIDAAYRFETNKGSEDSSNLYAISSKSGNEKGILLDAFDLYPQNSECSLHDQLKAPNLVYELEENSESTPMKYGIPKIFKSEFEEEPNRYVLRKGFPDFPPCPFGQSFTMLGYDNAEKRYVWLVTSIFKDERLGTEIYES